MLSGGGFLILTCPNGSYSAIPHQKPWRKHWGEVHPNFISDMYLTRLFKGYCGGVNDEDLSSEHIEFMIDTTDKPISSYLPTGGNLLAVFRKS